MKEGKTVLLSARQTINAAASAEFRPNTNLGRFNYVEITIVDDPDAPDVSFLVNASAESANQKKIPVTPNYYAAINGNLITVFNDDAANHEISVVLMA